MGQPRPLFVYFKYFKTQILQKKTEGFSRIRTRIVRVEGDHADHLTTTTAQLNILQIINSLIRKQSLQLLYGYNIMNKTYLLCHHNIFQKRLIGPPPLLLPLLRLGQCGSIQMSCSHSFTILLRKPQQGQNQSTANSISQQTTEPTNCLL